MSRLSRGGGFLVFILHLTEVDYLDEKRYLAWQKLEHMRKKENKPTLLFCVSDELMARIVSEYIDYVMNPYHEWRQTEEWSDRAFLNGFTMGNIPAPEPVEIPPEYQPLTPRSKYDGREPKFKLTHKPNRDKTEFHFRALIDMIYRRYQSSKGGWFILNRNVLSQVFDDGAPYMIITLSRFDIIRSEGRLMTIPNPDWFSCEAYRYAASVLPYKLRVNVLLTQYYRNEELVSEYVQRIVGEQPKNNQFLKQYQNNVSLLSFSDKAGLERYMGTPENFKSAHTRLHYQAFIDKVNLESGYLPEEKNVVSMGRNEKRIPIGRFYHIGTSLPKKLKRYTNIQYGIDAHNSHPLLFNYFILDYFYTGGSIGIDTDFTRLPNTSLFFLVSHFLSLIDNFSLYHNVKESLCKYLKENDIIQTDLDYIKKLPLDVLRYISASSRGRIWDDIQQRFPHYTRNQIKEFMFQYVFYSYATRTGFYNFQKREYVYLDRKEWVDMFKECYPSVMKVVNATKRKLHEECERHNKVSSAGKDMVQLPHLLMRFESVVFTRSLADAFRERIPVIGIHDCLAVIDGAVNINLPQRERLLDILRSHYREVGIVPSLSVEEY